jgi:hypothetical protein
MDDIQEIRQGDNASTVWLGCPVRQRWAEAAQEMARRGDDALLDPPIATAFDEDEWTW